MKRNPLPLTPEQHQALSQNEERPLCLVDPVTDQRYVLLPEPAYERLRALLEAGDDDPEALYPLLAELSPEDWEDPAVYGLTRKPTGTTSAATWSFSITRSATAVARRCAQHWWSRAIPTTPA